MALYEEEGSRSESDLQYRKPYLLNTASVERRRDQAGKVHAALHCDWILIYLKASHTIGPREPVTLKRIQDLRTFRQDFDFFLAENPCEENCSACMPWFLSNEEEDWEYKSLSGY